MTGYQQGDRVVVRHPPASEPPYGRGRLPTYMVTRLSRPCDTHAQPGLTGAGWVIRPYWPSSLVDGDRCPAEWIVGPDTPATWASLELDQEEGL